VQAPTPLEIWDLLVDGVPLHHRLDRDRLARGIEALGAGTATTATGADLRAARGFEVLVVGGGGAWMAPPGARVLPGGAFAGERGGRALLAARRWLVVDLGQTSVKVSWPGRRVRLPRAGRTARELLMRAFSCARADAVCVALPAAIDDHGAPGPSTYADLRGDLVDRCLRRAGLGHARRIVMNDAVLAACSARLSPAHDPARKTLVVTLGFGVGGAVLSSEA
jgi:hypothetical protein